MSVCLLSNYEQCRRSDEFAVHVGIGANFGAFRLERGGALRSRTGFGILSVDQFFGERGRMIEETMKFRDDPWLTDYLNAIHFAIRLIETRTRDRRALRRLKAETDALVQEAILGNIPMELFTIRRVAERIAAAERHLAGEPQALEMTSPPPLRHFSGDARALTADYRFLAEGYAEFSRRGLTAECALYFERIYPEVEDLDALVGELIGRDLAAGRIEEARPGVYRPTAGP